MRSAIAVLLWTGVLGAQDAPVPPIPEIHGVVLEAGTNLPVAGANVTIVVMPGTPTPISDPEEAGKTTTDDRGEFRVTLNKFATYLVRAEKAGYTDDGKTTLYQAPTNQLRTTLDKDKPTASARLLLTRSGELTGRVVDAETGKPVPNLRVFAFSVIYDRGEPLQYGGKSSVTDAEGQFVATGLRPGNYLAEIRPQGFDKEQILEKFSEADLQATDHDYQRSYWPGGGGFDSVLPVQVMSGGLANVGTLRARKVDFYRIHLSTPAAGCQQGEKVHISAEMLQFLDGGGFGEGSCGKDYLLRNFEPGAYMLYIHNNNFTPERRMLAMMPVEVTDRNLDLTLALGRGVDIDGRIAVADGSAKPPMEKIKLFLRVTGSIQFGYESQPTSPDAEGKFQFPNRPIARARIVVSGLPANFDVREIRYNGSAVADNIVDFNGNAPVQSLVIVVDDKPALVAGMVVDGDSPVGQASVVLIRWPASPQDVFLSAKMITADDGGRFHFIGLAPGEYRILAVSPAAAGKLDEPHVLERLLNNAGHFELSPGGSQTLTLKVTAPAR
jgi:protocatechuate 3,4-dioxygenase beta subunit